MRASLSTLSQSVKVTWSVGALERWSVGALERWNSPHPRFLWMGLWENGRAAAICAAGGLMARGRQRSRCGMGWPTGGKWSCPRRRGFGPGGWARLCSGPEGVASRAAKAGSRGSVAARSEKTAAVHPASPAGRTPKPFPRPRLWPLPPDTWAGPVPPHDPNPRSTMQLRGQLGFTNSRAIPVNGLTPAPNTPSRCAPSAARPGPATGATPCST
jgi:hypothetical protein